MGSKRDDGNPRGSCRFRVFLKGKGGDRPCLTLFESIVNFIQFKIAKMQ